MDTNCDINKKLYRKFEREIEAKGWKVKKNKDWTRKGLAR